MRKDALCSRGNLVLCAYAWHIVSAQTSLDEQALSRSLIPWSSPSGLIRGSETPNGYGMKATHWDGSETHLLGEEPDSVQLPTMNPRKREETFLLTCQDEAPRPPPWWKLLQRTGGASVTIQISVSPQQM